MSTDGVGQPNRIPVMRWIKGAGAFLVKSLHEKAFNSAATIAINEVQSAIDRTKDGRELKGLRNDERIVVLTLQTLEADMRRQFDEGLSSWPPKSGEGSPAQ